jgi:single-strand DNA-binding protein
MNFNSCMFVGNAGRAPEIRTTADGTTIASFSLAVSTWSREAEGKGEPIWLKIVAFGKLAETVEKFVKKGSQVLVAGRLSLREYTTKDGKERTSVEIIAQSIEVQHAQKQQESAVDIDEGDRQMNEQNGVAPATSDVAQPDIVQGA